MIRNTFNVYINGLCYSRVASAPLTGGNFLDERLDEMTLFLDCVDREIFPPLTPVEIVIINEFVVGETVIDTQTQTLYMIVANDSAEEAIVGKGLYNHELYLIEATKAAECVICDTQTVTNDLGRIYAGEDAPDAQPVWIT